MSNLLYKYSFKYFLYFYNLKRTTMKLTFKTLKGEIFNIEVEPEAKILQVKAKIQQQRGLEVETQKIVYRGKPAIDTDTITSLGIKEGDFLVIMNVPKKPVAKPKQQAAPQEQKQEKKQQKKQEKPVSKPEQKKQAPQPVPPSSQNQAQITQLMSMGFQRQKCVAALRASFNNTEVAVDYLINGIPSHALPNQSQSQQSSQNVEQVLRALMSTPQFEPIKQILQDDPTAINAVMQQIMATSPPLYNMIAQNPEAFQRVLMEDLEGEDDQGEFDDEGEEEEGGEEGQGQHIQITQEDDAAIKRLMSLGFSKIDAAQAYFACDKNEQLAANLLFDRQANGDLDQGIGGNQGGNNNGDDFDDDNLFN